MKNKRTVMAVTGSVVAAGIAAVVTLTACSSTASATPGNPAPSVTWTQVPNGPDANEPVRPIDVTSFCYHGVTLYLAQSASGSVSVATAVLSGGQGFC